MVDLGLQGRRPHSALSRDLVGSSASAPEMRGEDLERGQEAIAGESAGQPDPVSRERKRERARDTRHGRNLFTALIIVFRHPLHRRRSCTNGAVNGLTTNRRDLQGITSAFAALISLLSRRGERDRSLGQVGPSVRGGLSTIRTIRGLGSNFRPD